MERHNLGPSTHSQQIERWLGKEQAEHLSSKMRGFHWPIPVANVPGRIYLTGDGDYVGRINGGRESSLEQKIHDIMRRERRRRFARTALRARQHGGFASLSDLISEATTGGKLQTFNVAKTGVTGVANIANSLWDVGAVPAAGTVTAATEYTPTNTTTGGLRQADAGGGDTLHFVGATIVGTVAANTLLLVDRYYYYVHNIATQSPALSSVASRLQSTACKSSFIHAFVTSALGGTPGTYQVTYMDQDGNTDEANTAASLVAASIARRFPFAASVGNGWFLPFNAGDTGARKLTQITQSVSTGTGQIDVGLSKPICWIPIPIANIPVIIDGIRGAFNLSKIEDGACLCLYEINKGPTTATSYNGQIILCSG